MVQGRRQLLSGGFFAVLGFGAYRWLSGDKQPDDETERTSERQTSVSGENFTPSEAQICWSSCSDHLVSLARQQDRLLKPCSLSATGP